MNSAQQGYSTHTSIETQQLPFTGLDVNLLLVIMIGLLSAGAALRRLTRA